MPRCRYVTSNATKWKESLGGQQNHRLPRVAADKDETFFDARVLAIAAASLGVLSGPIVSETPGRNRHPDIAAPLIHVENDFVSGQG